MSKRFLSMVIISIFVYMGIINKIPGYENIAIYFLYLISFFLLIGAFYWEGVDNRHKIEKTISRSWYYIVIFIFLFHEYYLLATIFLAVNLIVLIKEADKRKKT